jgi:transposase-like protein
VDSLEQMSLEEFQHRFGTEENCAEYLFQAKWPDGFFCPRCGHRHAYKTATRRLPLYECRACRHQTSLTAGTVMEGSRTDLRKWLLALFLVSRTACGTNALQLSRVIGVTYKTAWSMLRKIRHAISQADGARQLAGIVRVNSAVYGRPYNPSFRRHPKEQLLLVGASVNERQQLTYVKMKLVAKAHLQEKFILRPGIEAFTGKHVDSEVTDIVMVTGRYSPKRIKPLLLLFSEARTWINDTFHGIGPKYLQAYLDEFCFRLNMAVRNVPIFDKLSQLCMQTQTVSYSAITCA